MTQLDTPYPSTAYLTGFLRSRAAAPRCRQAARLRTTTWLRRTERVDHDALGRALKKALYNYMHGIGLDADVRSWFGGQMPRTASRVIESGMHWRHTEPMPSPVLSFARVAAADLVPRRPSPASPDRHLLAAEAWLCRAQDATPDGGVSYGYSIRGGWRPSYPETTGYIATTFLRLARDRDPVYGERAQRALGWLCSVQNPDGSFANPRYGPGGIVFDTGQVLFGLVRGYEVSGNAALLQSARRAAAWLVDIADADKRWTRSEHKGVPHVYNARTAWALLRMNQVEFDPAREAVARSNLDWARAEQNEHGFFEHCSFEPGIAPFTHTVAYTARGLLEAGALLGDQRYVDAAERCARATLRHLAPDGWLPSTIAMNGVAASTSCCITGNCQFAIVWARLYSLEAGVLYAPAVMRALDYAMSTQDIETRDAGVHGGIKGSQPVWGRYACLSYPNWATKFFVDAMWLRQELDDGTTRRNSQQRL